MSVAFSTALEELTLVLFTTLAPSGVVAFVLMCLPTVAGRVDDNVCDRIDRFACIPVAVSLVGLVASATHLGNPANALYVVMGFGRSPLSNEVVAGAVFLGLAGIYWFLSFMERPRRRFRRVFAVIASIAGAAFIAAIALAYRTETVMMWYSPLVPVALFLNALAGGPLLAVASLAAAGERDAALATARLGLIVSSVAVAASVATYVLTAFSLVVTENHMVSLAPLAPAYAAGILAYAALFAAAIAIDARMVLRASIDLNRSVIASVLAFASIFGMRFLFYATHLTVGLGV